MSSFNLEENISNTVPISKRLKKVCPWSKVGLLGPGIHEIT
jgi:hypothetical protein